LGKPPDRADDVRVVLSYIMRCLVLAELSDDGPTRALEMASAGLEMALKDDGLSCTPALILFQTLIRLFGTKDQAHKAGKKVHEKIKDKPMPRKEWMGYLLRYNAGEINEDELQKAAETCQLCCSELYFYVGVTLLAEGKRNEAKDHFRHAVKTHAFFFF